MSEAGLRVALGLYEGPLDLLLELAREQKVDLRQISILRLVEQYIAYIQAAQRLRLDIAADYLVAAAWLAYLKSRLLLPSPARDDTPDAQEMADLLAFRLARLDALRRAGVKLMERALLGEHRFKRGHPDPLHLTRAREWHATLLDLARAWGRVEARESYRNLEPARREALAIGEAVQRMRTTLEEREGWIVLEECLPPLWRTQNRLRSGLASGFAASLELARGEGAELWQKAPFTRLYLRGGRKAGERA